MFSIDSINWKKYIIPSCIAAAIGFPTAASADEQASVLYYLLSSVIDRDANLASHYFSPTADWKKQDKILVDDEIHNIAAVSNGSKTSMATPPVAPAVGQVALAGLTVVTEFSPADGVQQLTFIFIDPLTGLPTIGPAVSYVTYTWIPQATDTSTLADLQFLGTSTDAADNWEIAFYPVFSSTFPVGAETLIVATPYDSNGDPLSIIDAEGENVAIDWLANIEPGAVPEPSTWALLCCGFGFLGILARRRRIMPTA